jgi:hypothetical protein
MLSAFGYYWCHDPDDDSIEPYLNLPTVSGRLDRQTSRGTDGSGQSCGWMIERRTSKIGASPGLVEFGIADTFEAAKHDCEAAILRNLTGHERIALAARGLR